MAKTGDHKYFWRLWTVQLNAISGALATAVGASVLSDMPKWVSVSIAGATLVVNALSMYVRTIVQSGLLEEDNEVS